MCHVRGWGGTEGADVHGPEAQGRRGRLVPRAQAVPPFPDLARTSDPGRSLAPCRLLYAKIPFVLRPIPLVTPVRS